MLVTGADGFIGSHLVEALLEEGASVRAFAFYNSFNSWGWLDTLPPDVLSQIEVITGDVRDPNGVRKACEGVDVVFHLAALIAIPFSYHSPDAYVDTNIRGTLNILQACREEKVRRLVVTSTSEVYGTACVVPMNEQHPLQGQSPYSATKIGADSLADSFHRSFQLPVVIARPFNTYGPRQSARAIIPTVITQILGGFTDIHVGSLHPTRDFNYVSDVCRGFISLAKCDAAIGKVVNIGSGVEVTIGDLVTRIVKLIGREVRIVSSDERKRPPQSEVERLQCDNTLIKALTKWEPSFSFDQGLIETVEWFRNPVHLNRYKPNLYNI